ncbi:hypothetical protein D3H55_09385 [Bacillus salacetis]|uniref:Uncharacterized protein n=1 Tax=Bacillus salacetis TaxID=2315464 RepID=A0A3A1R5U2_9BACI|nr:hypothetical protein [Bacillus salacetis]RIW34713.1 hypothetical protein D3H55_09385 [Bacillus salacetis]
MKHLPLADDRIEPVIVLPENHEVVGDLALNEIDHPNRRLFSHILLLSEKSQVPDFSPVFKGFLLKKNEQLLSFLLTGVFTTIYQDIS